MKNCYLNVVLNFGVELCVLQKKNENTLLINRSKEEK
jgi:hypothetical protein